MIQQEEIKRTAVFIDPTLKAAIKNYAKDRSTKFRSVSQQDIINEALAEYCRRHKLLSQ